MTQGSQSITPPSTQESPPPCAQTRPPIGVLFVCTGNICRSPTAEGIFRHLVQSCGLQDHFHIDSAGTSGWHVGDPPDNRAQKAARHRGIDLSAQRARRVDSDDFSDFDYLIAMDRGHQQALIRLAPSDLRDRIHLFMTFAAGGDSFDVPDPYYGGSQGFDHVLDMIESGCHGLLDHVKHHYPDAF